MNRLMIWQKLVMMIFIPLAWMIYYAVQETYKQLLVIDNITEIREITNLVIRISSLIHELQKERGLSAGYLASYSSKYNSELIKQRLQTDQQIQKLSNFLTSSKFITKEEEVEVTLERILLSLDSIGKKRDLVQQLNISQKDNIWYYTNINNGFFSVINHYLKNISNIKLAHMMTAYINLLRAKEEAGLERAVLNDAFSRGYFSPGGYEQFLTVTAGQNIFLNSFFSFASSTQIEFYYGNIRGEVTDNVEKIKQIAFEKRGQKYQVDPSKWWKVASKKINLLRKVGNFITNDIEIYVDHLEKNAYRSMITDMGIIVGAIVSTFILLSVALISITRPLKVLVSRANQISKGDSDIQISVQPFGEIGILSQAMSHMLQSIRDQEIQRREQEQKKHKQERLIRLGKLAEGVAHAIRNPLHGTMTCKDYLERRIGSEEPVMKEMLELMTSGLNRIGHVIDLMFTLTQDFPLKLDPYDLNLSLKSAVNTVAEQSQDKKVQLKAQYAKPSLVLMDGTILKKALLNLLQNALDACKEGDLVRTEISYLSKRDNEVCLTISDTGKGIPKKILNKVLDPFFSTKTAEEGVGIGLAVTGRIIEEHNGTLSLASELGVGTTVTIRLPIYKKNKNNGYISEYESDARESSTVFVVLKESK